MSLPAPLEQQLDSPTEEQLNADWLSQLDVGRILRQSLNIWTKKFRATIIFFFFLLVSLVALPLLQCSVFFKFLYLFKFIFNFIYVLIWIFLCFQLKVLLYFIEGFLAFSCILIGTATHFINIPVCLRPRDLH